MTRRKKLRQTTIANPSPTISPKDHYGDNCTVKLPHHRRFWAGNIQNFPTQVDHHDILGTSKDAAVFRVVKEHQVDQLGLVETGIDWRNVPPEDGLYPRSRKAQGPIKVTFAHNTTDEDNLNKAKLQPGGTAMCALQEHVPRVVDGSADPEGLGRWVSQVIEGKGAHHTRFVAAYKPCENRQGDNTVYVQHQQHYRRLESDKEPTAAFLADLKASIQQWQEAKERIIIYMDANEDVRRGPVASMFQALGMKEQVTSTH